MIHWMVYDKTTGQCAIDTIETMICYGNTDVFLKALGNENAMCLRFDSHKNAIRFMRTANRRGWIDTTYNPKGLLATAVVTPEELSKNKESEDNEDENSSNTNSKCTS